MSANEISPARLEAFSDGVIAIIITVMVLELKVPHHDTMADLLEQWPIFLSYALSFLLVAEYWMNHHQLFHLLKKVSTGILWANLLLLFCISLIPFFTEFMGENHISAFAVSAYSTWSFICCVAFMVLLLTVLHRVDMPEKDRQCLRHAALIKCFVAQLIYAGAAVAAFWNPNVALALNVTVAAMYFLPNAWLEPAHKKKR